MNGQIQWESNENLESEDGRPVINGAIKWHLRDCSQFLKVLWIILCEKLCFKNKFSNLIFFNYMKTIIKNKAKSVNI